MNVNQNVYYVLWRLLSANQHWSLEFMTQGAQLYFTS